MLHQVVQSSCHFTSRCSLLDHLVMLKYLLHPLKLLVFSLRNKTALQYTHFVILTWSTTYSTKLQHDIPLSQNSSVHNTHSDYQYMTTISGQPPRALPAAHLPSISAWPLPKWNPSRLTLNWNVSTAMQNFLGRIQLAATTLLSWLKTDNYSSILAILMNVSLLKRATAPDRKLFLSAKFAIMKTPQRYVELHTLELCSNRTQETKPRSLEICYNSTSGDCSAKLRSLDFLETILESNFTLL